MDARCQPTSMAGFRGAPGAAVEACPFDAASSKPSGLMGLGRNPTPAAGVIRPCPLLFLNSLIACRFRAPVQAAFCRQTARTR